MRLKKALLKTRHQKQSHQKQGHQKQGYQKHLIRSHFTRSLTELTKYSVRSVQPLTLRMPLQPPSLQLVSTFKTSMTIIFLQTLFCLKWNGFEIVLHRTIIKSGTRSMVKNQSFKQDKLMYRLVLNVSQILYK